MAVRPQATSSTSDLSQSVVTPSLDLHPRRRLRGNQVNPAVAAFQPTCVSEEQPAVMISSTFIDADRRHLHATMAEERDFPPSIVAANTPAGVRAHRYANAVNKRLLGSSTTAGLESGKFFASFKKANAARHTTDAVVFVAQPGGVSDISISSATDTSMREMHVALSERQTTFGIVATTSNHRSVFQLRQR